MEAHSQGATSSRYGVLSRRDCVSISTGDFLAVSVTRAASSTLIKAVSGAVIPDSGKIWLGRQGITLPDLADGRHAALKPSTRHRMSPALSITDNIFPWPRMRKPAFSAQSAAVDHSNGNFRPAINSTSSGLMTIQNIYQAVENPVWRPASGCGLVARAAVRATGDILDDAT